MSVGVLLIVWGLVWFRVEGFASLAAYCWFAVLVLSGAWLRVLALSVSGLGLAISGVFVHFLL